MTAEGSAGSGGDRESEESIETGNPAPTSQPGPFPGVRALAWLLTIGGGLAFLAAFDLAVEKFLKVADPDYVPSCSISPILACGSVMDAPQAEAFGFPNPLLGIAAFSAVVMFGVLLLTGMRPPRWIWIGLQLGTVFGVVFIHYLIGASLYDIHALCPYCMVVWAVMIPTFWYVTLYNLTTRNIPVPGSLRSVVRALAKWHGVILFGWFTIIVALIADTFWDYWMSLF